jgi:nitric oxide reductase NorD protein
VIPAGQGHGLERVSFCDIHRLLALFAQGLAGRYLHLRPRDGDEFARESRSANDDSIFLPAQIECHGTARFNLGAYRIAVLRQIGYWVEGTSEFDLKSFLAESRSPGLLRQLFFILEDLRIDAALRRRYPGARADLERVQAHALKNCPQPGALPPLAALIEALVQFSLGAPRAALVAIDSSGLLDRLIDTASAVQTRSAGCCDSARAALAICAELENLSAAPSAQTASASAESSAQSATAPRGGEMGPGFDDTGGVDAVIEIRGATVSDRALRHRAAHGRATTARQPLAGAAAPTATDIAADSPAGLRARSPLAAVQSRGDTGPRSFLYDEWDYNRQSYLPAWCRLFEHRLRGDDFKFIEDVRRRHSALAQQVRRQFGFIKPQAFRRVRRTSDGDELELDGLIEAVIDRRTGHAGDSHLYVRRDRASRDVAAAFLVDMSASTDFPLPAPANPGSAKTAQPGVTDSPAAAGGLYLYADHDETPDPVIPLKRRVIDVSKDALALMCDALRALGDSYAIYGFSGDGRDNVEFHVAKDFNDKLSARTWGALAAMQPRRSTRMGTAIRHALRKLAGESAGIKVLIIVSDGYPEDHDYGPDRTDREYGIQDTARALREVERAGVTDFCVTIDPAGHDYLRRMCKQTRYLVIGDVTALPRELTKIYRTLTAR